MANETGKRKQEKNDSDEEEPKKKFMENPSEMMQSRESMLDKKFKVLSDQKVKEFREDGFSEEQIEKVDTREHEQLLKRLEGYVLPPNPDPGPEAATDAEKSTTETEDNSPSGAPVTDPQDPSPEAIKDADKSTTEREDNFQSGAPVIDPQKHEDQNTEDVNDNPNAIIPETNIENMQTETSMKETEKETYNQKEDNSNLNGVTKDEEAKTMKELEEEYETIDESEKNIATLIILGGTGSGISATGNSILNLAEDHQPMFTTHDSATSQTECFKKTTLIYDVEDTTYKLNVVDTPGFNNTFNKKVTREEFVPYIDDAVFVYVHNLSSHRHTEEARNAQDNLKNLFGDKVFKHTMLVFTHADMSLKDKTLNELIEDEPSHSVMKQLVREDVDNRVIAVNNKAETAIERDVNQKRIIDMALRVIKREGGYVSEPQPSTWLSLSRLWPYTTTSQSETQQDSSVENTKNDLNNGDGNEGDNNTGGKNNVGNATECMETAEQEQPPHEDDKLDIPAPF